MIDQLDLFAIEKEAKRVERAKKTRQMAVVKAKRSGKAAEALAAAGPGDLDLRLLLDELTVDVKISWIVIRLPTGKAITVSRPLLRQLGTMRRRRKTRLVDVRAWLDSDGLHVRWGQHGGMDLDRALPIDKGDTTLVVAFPKISKLGSIAA